jgi:hypothetical protein
LEGERHIEWFVFKWLRCEFKKDSWRCFYDFFHMKKIIINYWSIENKNWRIYWGNTRDIQRDYSLNGPSNIEIKICSLLELLLIQHQFFLCARTVFCKSSWAGM